MQLGNLANRKMAVLGLAALAGTSLTTLFLIEKQAALVPIRETLTEVNSSLANFTEQTRPANKSESFSAAPNRKSKNPEQIAEALRTEQSARQTASETENQFATTPGIYGALSAIGESNAVTLDEKLKASLLKQLPYSLSDEEFSKLLHVSKSIVNGVVRQDLALDSTKVTDERLQEIASVIAIVYKQAEFLHVAQTNLPNIKSLADIPDWSRSMLSDKTRQRSAVDKAVFGSALQNELLGIIKTLTEMQIPISEWASFGIFPR